MSGFLINPFESFGGVTLLDAIQSSGVPTANLKACLDVADIASYDGTSQTWFDVSGNATDFFLGISGTSGATDPTFNGTAGVVNATTYWSFDGGDIFNLTTTNPAWMQTLHKNAATYTIMAAYYPGGAGPDECILGTTGDTGTGIEFGRLNTAPNHLYCFVRNGASTALLAVTSSVNQATGAWSIVGLSVSENAGAAGGIFFANNATETFNPNYTSPSAGSSAANASISSVGGNSTTGAFRSGARFAWIAIWDIALTAAQMQSIYTQTRGRFNI